MSLKIYQRNSGLIRAEIQPDDKSVQQCGIMKYDMLTLSFDSATWLDFKTDDYCLFLGSKYFLHRPFEYDQKGNRDFSYSMVMEGYYHRLSRAQYFTLNANNKFTEGKFSLREKPIGFAQLIITNMQSKFPQDNWKLGQVIDADYATLDFDGENCLEAAVKLASAFGTEFHIIGTTFHLIKRQQNTGITLRKGLTEALVSLGRKNQDNNLNPLTRLYAYGSDQNLGLNYRNGAPRLRLAGALYIEQNVDEDGLFEKTVVFDDIKPEREGVVSAVAANDTFTDALMDFDINAYLLPGVTAKVTFNTGLLAGITFEINNYNAATKSFKFNPNTDSQTVVMPSNDFKPTVGDRYVIVDITMPPAYVQAAEAKLLQRAWEYFRANGTKFSYPVKCNPLYYRDNEVPVDLAGAYQLVNEQTGINVTLRLIEYSRNIRRPYLIEKTLADVIVPQPQYQII